MYAMLSTEDSNAAGESDEVKLSIDHLTNKFI